MTSDPDTGFDSKAFEARFVSCYPSLWSVAAAVLGSREGAEDAVQDAANIGLQKLGDFDQTTDFGAWMGQIVRNVARNAARKRNRRRSIPIESTAISANEQPNTNRHVGTHGELPATSGVFDDSIHAALEDLSEEARACLLLRVVQNQPYEQIALLLGIPKGTAMSHVHRARKRLRVVLSTPAMAASSTGGAAHA